MKEKRSQKSRWTVALTFSILCKVSQKTWPNIQKNIINPENLEVCEKPGKEQLHINFTQVTCTIYQHPRGSVVPVHLIYNKTLALLLLLFS
jgi:hypothetical protein